MDKKEQAEGFRCSHCRRWVSVHEHMGTAHRNHCPACLWSKHVDENQPGDRSSQCLAGMEPAGLTLKHEGADKYGMPKKGELMIVHLCSGCHKVNINRVAADDDPVAVVDLLDGPGDKKVREQIETQDIDILKAEDKRIVLRQLYGSPLG